MPFLRGKRCTQPQECLPGSSKYHGGLVVVYRGQTGFLYQAKLHGLHRQKTYAPGAPKRTFPHKNATIWADGWCSWVLLVRRVLVAAW